MHDKIKCKHLGNYAIWIITLMALIDAETDWTHQVCRRLMLSSLQHLDNRAQVDECDYQYNPITGVVQKSCPKYNYYLRDFLIHIMEVTNFYAVKWFDNRCQGYTVYPLLVTRSLLSTPQRIPTNYTSWSQPVIVMISSLLIMIASVVLSPVTTHLVMSDG